MEGYVENSEEQEDSYYRCSYCHFKLPKKNFDLLKHSCFANMNLETENIVVDENNYLFKG